MLAGESFQFAVNVPAPKCGFPCIDISAVTSGSLKVFLPGQLTGIIWPGTVTIQASSDQALGSYAFTGAELPTTAILGTYVFEPILSYPGGSLRGVPFRIQVIAENDTGLLDCC